MNRAATLALALLALGAGAAQAQSAPRYTGPVIPGFGAVLPVPDPDFATPLDRDYRVLFEVSQTAADPAEVNTQLNSVARFLNMHARAGVPPQRLHAVAVVHGPAGRDMLDDALYRERTGVANPNLPLLEELRAAGVRIVLCGQTAASRDLPRDRLAPPVEVALSAMTAMIVFQDQGFRVIPW